MPVPAPVTSMQNVQLDRQAASSFWLLTRELLVKDRFLHRLLDSFSGGETAEDEGVSSPHTHRLLARLLLYISQYFCVDVEENAQAQQQQPLQQQRGQQEEVQQSPQGQQQLSLPETWKQEEAKRETSNSIVPRLRAAANALEEWSWLQLHHGAWASVPDSMRCVFAFSTFIQAVLFCIAAEAAADATLAPAVADSAAGRGASAAAGALCTAAAESAQVAAAVESRAGQAAASAYSAAAAGEAAQPFPKCVTDCSAAAPTAKEREKCEAACLLINNHRVGAASSSSNTCACAGSLDASTINLLLPNAGQRCRSTWSPRVQENTGQQQQQQEIQQDPQQRDTEQQERWQVPKEQESRPLQQQQHSVQRHEGEQQRRQQQEEQQTEQQEKQQQQTKQQQQPEQQHHLPEQQQQSEQQHQSEQQKQQQRRLEEQHLSEWQQKHDGCQPRQEQQQQQKWDRCRKQACRRLLRLALHQVDLGLIMGGAEILMYPLLQTLADRIVVQLQRLQQHQAGRATTRQHCYLGLQQQEKSGEQQVLQHHQQQRCQRDKNEAEKEQQQCEDKKQQHLHQVEQQEEHVHKQAERQMHHQQQQQEPLQQQEDEDVLLKERVHASGDTIVIHEESPVLDEIEVPMKCNFCNNRSLPDRVSSSMSRCSQQGGREDNTSESYRSSMKKNADGGGRRIGSSTPCMQGRRSSKRNSTARRNRVPAVPHVEAAEYSMEDFISHHLSQQQPVLIVGGAASWPAVLEWSDWQVLLLHLRERLLPIEVGRAYTTRRWTQKLLRGEVFFKSFLPSNIIHAAQTPANIVAAAERRAATEVVATPPPTGAEAAGVGAAGKAGEAAAQLSTAAAAAATTAARSRQTAAGAAAKRAAGRETEDAGGGTSAASTANRPAAVAALVDGKTHLRATEAADASTALKAGIEITADPEAVAMTPHATSLEEEARPLGYQLQRRKLMLPRVRGETAANADTTWRGGAAAAAAAKEGGERAREELQCMRAPGSACSASDVPDARSAAAPATPSRETIIVGRSSSSSTSSKGDSNTDSEGASKSSNSDSSTSSKGDSNTDSEGASESSNSGRSTNSRDSSGTESSSNNSSRSSDSSSTDSSCTDSKKKKKKKRGRGSRCFYMAQHPLLEHVPALARSCLIPDFALCGAETEQLTRLMWIGPAGTVSPAHTDKAENIFVQGPLTNTSSVPLEHFFPAAAGCRSRRQKRTANDFLRDSNCCTSNRGGENSSAPESSMSSNSCTSGSSSSSSCTTRGSNSSKTVISSRSDEEKRKKKEEQSSERKRRRTESGGQAFEFAGGIPTCNSSSNSDTGQPSPLDSSSSSSRNNTNAHVRQPSSDSNTDDPIVNTIRATVTSSSSSRGCLTEADDAAAARGSLNNTCHLSPQGNSAFTSYLDSKHSCCITKLRRSKDYFDREEPRSSCCCSADEEQQPHLNSSSSNRVALEGNEREGTAVLCSNGARNQRETSGSNTDSDSSSPRTTCSTHRAYNSSSSSISNSSSNSSNNSSNNSNNNSSNNSSSSSSSSKTKTHTEGGRSAGWWSRTSEGGAAASKRRRRRRRKLAAAYPLFQREQGLEAVVRPGDMLYIPKGWWHFVVAESASVSISHWFS